MPIIVWWGVAGAIGLIGWGAKEGVESGVKQALTGAGIGAGAYLAWKAFR